MKPLYLGIIALLVVGSIFFVWQRQNDNQQLTPETAMPLDEESMLETTVISLTEQNDLGQTGEATITADETGMAIVTLSMIGGDFPEPQPAHIHQGSCPKPGAVTYPLTNVVDGASVTTLEVSYDELMSVPEAMAINVHKSAAEASIYTACGDLNY